MSPHSASVPVESIFEFLGEQERENKEQKTWPRMAMSLCGRSDGWRGWLWLGATAARRAAGAVAQHYVQRGDLAIGPQHVKTMDPGRVPLTR